MEFFNLLNSLKEKYKDELIIRKNGTILFGQGKIPKTNHMLFKGLKQEYIDEFLIDAYKNKFPEEYIEFLKYSNGADLFWVKLKSVHGFDFASTLFTILGLPLTPPYERASDMEEPFDIRVEDLARHENTPKTWLKCGNYYRNYNLHTQTDIFIDTTSGKVYACEKNKCEVLEEWGTLDECFCSIFNSFRGYEKEYDFI